ncbi:MAG: prolyl-tRNA synthetase associated domain-containing protein [Oscillibacter sp.]|nr:prolyl-tRNA synthetase associated domain-containing protein [Oscillibacter sp.]
MPAISSVYHGAPQEAREAVEADTYALLEKLHIPFDRVDTPPAYTMEDCGAISEALGVSVCKNLLLTPRSRSTFYLLALPADKPFVTKDFSKQIGSSRLSFATAEDLAELLGVQPGSASVLALRNDTAHRVQLAMERSVYKAAYFGCHPCRNTSTIRLKTDDLLHLFLPYTGHEPLIVDL